MKNIVALFFLCLWGASVSCFDTDLQARDYCLSNRHTTIVTLWPNVWSTNKVDRIEKSLSHRVKIKHKKQFRLINKGPFFFIAAVYAIEQARIGHKQDVFKLARSKERQAFKGSNIVNVYLVETDDIEELLEYKRQLRTKYKLNFLHIPDTHKEAEALAALVFSDKQINKLNAKGPSSDLPVALYTMQKEKQKNEASKLDAS